MHLSDNTINTDLSLGDQHRSPIRSSDGSKPTDTIPAEVK